MNMFLILLKCWFCLIFWEHSQLQYMEWYGMFDCCLPVLWNIVGGVCVPSAAGSARTWLLWASSIGSQTQNADTRWPKVQSCWWSNGLSSSELRFSDGLNRDARKKHAFTNSGFEDYPEHCLWRPTIALHKEGFADLFPYHTHWEIKRSPQESMILVWDSLEDPKVSLCKNLRNCQEQVNMSSW